MCPQSPKKWPEYRSTDCNRALISCQSSQKCFIRTSKKCRNGHYCARFLWPKCFVFSSLFLFVVSVFVFVRRELFSIQSPNLYVSSEVRLPPMDFVLHFSSDFHKKRFTRSQMCRTALKKFWPWNIQRWVKRRNRTTWGRSQHIKVVELLQNLRKKNTNYFQSFGSSIFSKVTRSVPSAGFRPLTHHSTLQDQYFPAHFELASCDTPESMWWDN